MRIVSRAIARDCARDSNTRKFLRECRREFRVKAYMKTGGYLPQRSMLFGKLSPRATTKRPSMPGHSRSRRFVYLTPTESSPASSRKVATFMTQEGVSFHLLSRCSLLATAPSLTEVRRRSSYSRRLERFWSFIEESYADPDIRLTDAARCSGASPDHLNRLLGRFAGTTFHHLLSRYRIEKSLELLHERNYTLTEIYSRCGFNSSTTFDRQFKKWVGCLPSEYKRRITFYGESRGHSRPIAISE